MISIHPFMGYLLIKIILLFYYYVGFRQIIMIDEFRVSSMDKSIKKKFN